MRRNVGSFNNGSSRGFGTRSSRGIGTRSDRRSVRGNNRSATGFDRGSNRQNLEECSSILQSIVSNNDIINGSLQNGNLLKLLNSGSQLSRDQIYQLLTSITQFCNNENSTKSIKEVFILILNSRFIVDTLEPLIKDYFNKSPTLDEIKISCSFLIKCLELLPNQFFEKMGLIYPSIHYACAQFNDSQLRSLQKTLNDCFESAKVIHEDDKKLSFKLSKAVNINFNNFRDSSIMPQSSDIFCLNEEVALRPNKISGLNGTTDSKYESVEDYLDTQFGLLKEDFMRPLRDGIATIRNDFTWKGKLETKHLQIRLYENVTVEEMYTSRNGLVHKVIFDVSRFKKIDWKKARRFIHGSLLCFTNNFFETIYFSTVVESDPKTLEKGIIVVQFDNDPINEVLNDNIFMMIETKNLFEAYRHVLVKLQKFTNDTLPFKDYLVFGDNFIRAPVFMNKNDLRLIEIEGMRHADLDDSQRTAFVNTLKSSLALIQGPPGTGKTYVGLKIIKYLASHFQCDSKHIGPILVVCYTNHALDQFLFDIIKAIGIENVIRVGGRSKMEEMKDCNINSIKGKWIRKKAFSQSLYRRGIQNRRDIEVAEENLIRKYVKVKNYDRKLLPLSELQCCLNHRELEYFRKINFDSWIKGGDLIFKIDLETFSDFKQMIIKDEFVRCMDDISRESLTEFAYELFAEFEVPVEDNDDILVEDPDDVLNNERFLDDDIGLLKKGNRFQSWYDELDNNINGLNNGAEDEEGFKCVATVKLIKNRLKKTKPLSDEEYTNLTSLDVDFNLRLRLYKYWLTKYRIILIEQYEHEKSKFDLVSKEREEIHADEYVAIMKSMKVIGMTTTGAARYGTVLDKVGCQVVVIEEAAEVMEAHVVCSLSDNCEHLIMIGDHKQLRPKVDVYDLEINYNLGISLFERLIGNKCQYFTLEYQHRMRPEISVCMKPIYPNLKDSEVVFNYPSVSGMRKDIYFFNHQNNENSDNETSYRNDFEAEFVAKLCEYLIKNGNLPTSITVLTLYSGQLYNINKRMRQQMFRGIRICVIDNYQGEENEIIILSFVRSNPKDIIGFVASENRLCVTLSRAKRGFYAIGNFNMICRKSNLLDNIISKHLDKKSFGSKLPLQCLMHLKEDKYVISRLEDFQRTGCPSKCHLLLPCGDVCMWTCHRDEPSHKNYKCKMPCTKKCARNLHECKLLCHQKCECNENVEIRLPCGHNKNIICNQTKLLCTEICEKVMDCRHACVRMCHEKCKCEIKIRHLLECGHELDLDCGTDISVAKCLELCEKMLGCGHPCEMMCHEQCTCKQLIEYTLPCSHKRRLKCGTDINLVRCNVIVNRKFGCGHSVQHKCFDTKDNCNIRVDKLLNCGHMGNVLCGANIDDAICLYVCEMTLDCRHKCQGKCGDCYRGRLHVACTKRCRKFLRCGHYCDYECHPGFCPPCGKPCLKYCEHSQCTVTCGQPCGCKVCDVNCNKTIKCADCKKSEKCSKSCGETCSKLCNICSNSKNKDDQLSYIMEPCNCYVLKSEFQPKKKIEGKETYLLCQNCNTGLRTPYSGVVLLFFKREYSEMFQEIPETEILKWKSLFGEIEKVSYLRANFQRLIETLITARICKEDTYIFDISFKYYSKLTDICKNMVSVDGDKSIERYHQDVKLLLVHLIKWLNPFSRRFGLNEIILLKSEMSTLFLSADIISFLTSVTVTDYALIHKQLFAILDEIEKVVAEEDLEELWMRFDEIKKNLNNTKDCSEEDEQLVDRIINATDIYKEFGMYQFGVEEKLKEIKNLIKRCHPDKNRSARAKQAVIILLEKKRLLE